MHINTHTYIIQGGKEGKDRLNTLSEVLQPFTKSLLSARGLSAGHHFLDMGCGGGNVALTAAEMVGSTGMVKAIDFDEKIIALAESDAETAGVSNVSFEAMSAYDVNYEDSFDIAYARFLMSHLKRPAEVLQKMADSVKSGGKVVVEDVHFSGHFCYPESDAFDWYVEHYTTLAHKNGQNAEIGPSLFNMFRQAGLKNVGFDVIQPCFYTGPGKWMAHLTLDRIKESLIKHKMATPQTIENVLYELEEFTNDDKTIMSLPRIFRVWGTR